MAEFNLDEARAARAESQAERSFVFGGERFALPAELPYEMLGAISALARDANDLGAIRLTMVALLGEAEHARFEALRPSIADLNDLVGWLFTEYGLADGDPAKNGSGELDPKSAPSLEG